VREFRSKKQYEIPVSVFLADVTREYFDRALKNENEYEEKGE
jgi:hypothetical protein